MAPVEHIRDPSFEASLAVMRAEIAWFKTLEDDTIERIADTAPVESPEYAMANAELERRAAVAGSGHSSRVSPPPGA